jgi:rhodanese-related sulfurtransferase
VDVTPPALHERIQAGEKPALLDVRTSREFARGRVPGAVRRPFWRVLFGLTRLPFKQDEPVIVYCLYGPRAWMAGTALRWRGYRNIRYLAGHMARWRRERLPQETDS